MLDADASDESEYSFSARKICVSAKAKSSKRENKCKGNFQEELLDLQWEQMFLQQEQEKESNKKATLYRVFLPLSKK